MFGKKSLKIYVITVVIIVALFYSSTLLTTYYPIWVRVFSLDVFSFVMVSFILYYLFYFNKESGTIFFFSLTFLIFFISSILYGVLVYITMGYSEEIINRYFSLCLEVASNMSLSDEVFNTLMNYFDLYFGRTALSIFLSIINLFKGFILSLLIYLIIKISPFKVLFK